MKRGPWKILQESGGRKQESKCSIHEPHGPGPPVSSARSHGGDAHPPNTSSGRDGDRYEAGTALRQTRRGRHKKTTSQRPRGAQIRNPQQIRANQTQHHDVKITGHTQWAVPGCEAASASAGDSRVITSATDAGERFTNPTPIRQTLSAGQSGEAPAHRARDHPQLHPVTEAAERSPRESGDGSGTRVPTVIQHRPGSPEESPGPGSRAHRADAAGCAPQ